MTEERQSAEEGAEAQEDRSSKKARLGDGIRQGIGVLSAFKDALEETIQEARERGDLSAERAKEVMKDALEKAQTAAEGAKDRLDFAHQADFESLRDTFTNLQERVAALETSVFGAPKASARATAGPQDASDADERRTGASGASEQAPAAEESAKQE